MHMSHGMIDTSWHYSFSCSICMQKYNTAEVQLHLTTIGLYKYHYYQQEKGTHNMQHISTFR